MAPEIWQGSLERHFRLAVRPERGGEIGMIQNRQHFIRKVFAKAILL